MCQFTIIQLLTWLYYDPGHSVFQQITRLPLAFFSSSWSPALLPGPGTYDPATSESKQWLSQREIWMVEKVRFLYGAALRDLGNMAGVISHGY